MPFKLTIIGSGSAVPTVGRGVTSQYINFNERHILVDCGEGTQLQLRRFRIKFQRIQKIFISHLHGDHYLGLVGLLSSMSLLGRTKKLIVYGPHELEELLNFQFKVAGIQFSFHLEFVRLNNTGKQLIFEDNILKVHSFPVKHRIPCWGFLFEEKVKEPNIDPGMIKKHGLSIEEIVSVKQGNPIERDGKTIPADMLTLPSDELISYAFSSDTMYFDKMIDYVKGVNLLYHEATFTEKYKDRAIATMHSTAAEAATVAQKAGVQKLLLGHFSARFKETDEVLNEARTIFKNTICVEDGDEFIL